MNMACKAMIREREEDKLWDALIDEMYLYNQVKSEWGLGHIRLKLIGKYELEQRVPVYRYNNPLMFYVEISGYYVDSEDCKQLVFLGNGYWEAFIAIDRVKLSL